MATYQGVYRLRQKPAATPRPAPTAGGEATAANGGRSAGNKRSHTPRGSGNIAAAQPIAQHNLLDRLRLLGFQLGERIGKGSYSKVYQATKNYTSSKLPVPAPMPTSSASHGDQQVPAAAELKRYTTPPIACKVIDARRTSPEYLHKFLPRELELVKALHHPHIVRVYDIIEIGPFVCCFMELCAGGDLLDAIRAGGKLTASVAHLYFGQLVAAVAYLHAEHVAHRDIKCENVLLDKGRRRVKLTDFGFARPLSKLPPAAKKQHRSDTVQPDIRYSETFCGSAAYAAPEVLQSRPYDPRRYDMWSMGCVLFVMVTATMPFDEENVAQMIRQQERRELVYPTEAEGDSGGKVAASLRQVIARLLEPDVDRRLTIAGLIREPWVQAKQCELSGETCAVCSTSASTEAGCAADAKAGGSSSEQRKQQQQQQSAEAPKANEQRA